MSKPRMGRMGLAVLLLLFGIIPLLFGYIYLQYWADESVALFVCAALFFMSGTTMLVSGVWLLVTLGRQRLPLWAGGIAAMVSGGLFVGASLTHVLPCSGPD
jgi:hypothetical protein